MANAVLPRIQGDDYQARWFWRNICRLFEPGTKVLKVCYEADDVKSFDDVVVEYGPGMLDEAGKTLQKDFYQIKFHVNAAGAFTAKAMMDPDFINAKSVSLLQRLRDAQKKHAPGGTGVRFIILSPWTVDPHDLLATIHSHANGTLSLDEFFGAGPRSKLGKMRSEWRTHVGLTDAELRLMLTPLRIHLGSQLNPSQDDLSARLIVAGFAPIDTNQLTNPYDDLVRKLLGLKRRCEYTRQQIQDICQREGLWRGTPPQLGNPHRLGIRSFSRAAENLAAETDGFLCLLEHFQEREIKDPGLWHDKIFPSLQSFLAKELNGKHRCLLHINAHASVAFAVGYLTDSKTGVEVVPVQRCSSGQQIWLRAEQSGHMTTVSCPDAVFNEERISTAGRDVALAISITRDVSADVRSFCKNSLTSVGRIVHCQLGATIGSSAIQSGPHAWKVAESVAAYLKTNRSEAERAGVLHIFAAAPNGLVMFLGQLARGFGNLRLYEYDFESNAPGAYTLSIALPLKPNKD